MWNDQLLWNDRDVWNDVCKMIRMCCIIAIITVTIYLIIIIIAILYYHYILLYHHRFLTPSNCRECQIFQGILLGGRGSRTIVKKLRFLCLTCVICETFFIFYIFLCVCVCVCVFECVCMYTNNQNPRDIINPTSVI